jgi:hypothetical protein
MKDVYRCTKPGGYVALGELGMTVYSDDNTMGPGFDKYIKLLVKGLTDMGRPQATGKMLKDRLEKAGFVDVVVRDIKQPFGPWPKEKRLKNIGAMVMLQSDPGIEAYGMAVFTRSMGIEVAEAIELCKNAWNDVHNKNYHMYSML